jgi:hypothetical protein
VTTSLTTSSGSANEHPDAMAKQMAQRREVRSAALPVLAAALVLPATALYVIDWRLAPFVVAATIAAVVRRLRIEREWIDAEDPAAGSKLFTLRDAVAAVRRAYRFVRPRARRSTVVVAAAGAALIAVGATSTGRLELSPRWPSAQAAPGAPLPEPSPEEEPGSPGAALGDHVESIDKGQVRMAVELENGATVEIPGIAGLESVPAGWYARIVVRLAGSAPGPVRVPPLVGEVRTNLEYQTNAIISTIEVCGPHPGQLGLHVGAPGNWPEGRHAVSLIIEPQLSLSPCRGEPGP